jgi:RNA polymerase sigma factor (sigma-70 family)
MGMTFWDHELQEERRSPVIPTELWDWNQLREIALWAARRSYNGDDIEDFVQTALAKMHEKQNTVKYPKAYIKRTVTNLIIDFRRSAAENTSSGFTVPEPGDYQWKSARDIFGRPIEMIKPKDVAHEIASSAFFAALLGYIPEGKRDLFIDHLEGVPNNELAEIYGYSSAATVRQTLMRIRQDLKRDAEAAGLMKGL